MTAFTESVVEEAALDWYAGLGYAIVNGLAIAPGEPQAERDDFGQAFNQLQTYKAEIPSLFTFNEALVISDGLTARLGSLTADRERFQPWRTISGEGVAERTLSELQVLIEGVFEKRRFLDLIRYFTVFEDEGGGKLLKKMAGYHQFHAVNVAVEETLRAADLARTDRALREREGVYFAGPPRDAQPGDRRIGVVWHTQGSGKSLTMVFYAGRAILHPAMENPTLVILTDRIDLDNQLFGVFARCQELLRQPPAQAESRADARNADLGLAEDEIAFYDALEVNDSAVKVLGDGTLRTIARELVKAVKSNVTIDWTRRENVRAQLRVIVKRILRNYGYPPDKQEKATQTVLEQAEALAGEWDGVAAV